MRRSLGLTARGLRLTGRPDAARIPPQPPVTPAALLVTESGARLVDELGNALAIRETAS